MFQKAFSKIGILVIVLVVILGGFLAYQQIYQAEESPEEGNGDLVNGDDEPPVDDTGLKTYEFMGEIYEYPADWEIEEQSYLTPGQQDRGEDPSVGGGFYLRPINQTFADDSVSVGGRQISCRTLQVGYKCSTPAPGFHPIYTKSINPEVLEVYEALLDTDERIKNIEALSADRIQSLQDLADKGIAWVKSPLETAKTFAMNYGFNYTDEFTLKLQAASAGVAEVEAVHNNSKYLITLLRNGDIWLINSIVKQ